MSYNNDADEDERKMAVAPPPKKNPFLYDIDPFGNISKYDYEKMQKIKEMERYLLDDYEKKPKSKSKATAKESLQSEKTRNSERILSAQQQNERIDKALEFISNLPFQEGDVAFHKEHGNVIVDEIVINMVDVEQSSYYIIARGTKCNVPYQELVPISDATKILFSKK